MPNKLVVLFAGIRRNSATPGVSLFDAMQNIIMLSARSVSDAAIWIGASKRIDLLIVDVRLSDDLTSRKIAQLAVSTHPRVAIVAMSADQSTEATDWPERCAFVRGSCRDETLAVAIDQAFISLSIALA